MIFYRYKKTGGTDIIKKAKWILIHEKFNAECKLWYRIYRKEGSNLYKTVFMDGSEEYFTASDV